MYQTLYRKSLIRTAFCVSDKVDVSGTDFNTCLLVLTGYSMFVSTFGHLYFQRHILHLLWLNGLLWFVYLMFAMIGYRDPRELCFYCKFSMLAGSIHFILLCVVSKGDLPLLLFVVMFVIFLLVAISSVADRMERKRIWKEK